MIPASFHESNHVLDKPEGMTRDQCEALSVCCCPDSNGFPVVISCWKPTAEELAEIQRTGRVWLMIWGVTMPPACVLGSSPFIAPGAETTAE